MIAILVGCYVNGKDKQSHIRPPLPLFFEKFFESLHTKHEYRIILSDDGSVSSMQRTAKDLASQYPIEVYLRDLNIGEGANLRYMSSLLKDEDYVIYISNDCFVRNLDRVDWMQTEIDILNKFNCNGASIAAGYYPKGEWSYQPLGEYKKFGWVSTQHFMMKRRDFDEIPWDDMVTTIGSNFTAWEGCLNSYLKREHKHIAYSTDRLGMWSIMRTYSYETVKKILYTTEDLPNNC